MLAVEQGEDTSNVNCWMDIRKGRFPEVRNSYDKVRLWADGSIDFLDFSIEN